MTLNELYKRLDLEAPEDFCYFEQMAELLECEEEIEFDLFCVALSGLDPETAQDLIENYFNDLSDALPDSDDEIISLIETIKQNLLMCAESLDAEGGRKDFAEQLFRFRTWYQKPDGALVDGEGVSVLNAAAEYRAEKLGHGKHSYDFSPSYDYELEEISIRLGAFSKIDLIGEDEENV